LEIADEGAPDVPQRYPVTLRMKLLGGAAVHRCDGTSAAEAAHPLAALPQRQRRCATQRQRKSLSFPSLELADDGAPDVPQRYPCNFEDGGFWVAQRFTAAIQALMKSTGFSR